MTISPKCLAKLLTCELELQRLVNAVAEWQDVVIVQGIRTEAEQTRNVATGASRTMRSKHLPTADNPLSRAIDMGPSPLDWNDTEGFLRFAQNIVLPKARELGIPIRWGGAWDGMRNPPGAFDDLVHFELKEG